MLIEFTKYNDSYENVVEKVFVNPAYVMSVLETTRRPSGGFFKKVAIVQQSDGTSITVNDSCRDVIKLLKG